MSSPSGRRAGPVALGAVTGSGYFRPLAHGPDRMIAFLAADGSVLDAHWDSRGGRRPPLFQELGLHPGLAKLRLKPSDLGVLLAQKILHPKFWVLLAPFRDRVAHGLRDWP